MKKNNKGISLVSLVIVIIVTIILISIVVTVGYDYIQESNRTKTTAVVKFIADAATQRQNDKHINATAYYIGYQFVGNNLDKIKGLPDGFAIKSEDMWYLIDAKSAEKLGIIDSHKYIEEDLKNPTKDIVKTVLVDYVTGEAYLIEIDKTLLAGYIEDSICAAGGSHLYSIQTCIKGSLCINCGEPNPGHENALGHDYAEPTCTAAATCKRCKEIDVTRPATGHNFELDGRGEEKWTTDAIRHWKECTVCGSKKETEEHEKGCVRIEISPSTYDAKYHTEVCSICGWQSVKTDHKIKYEITGDNTHRRFCELCEYSEEHRDSGWKNEDEYYHWRECNETCPTKDDGNIDCIEGDKLFYAPHEDKNRDSVCDVCSKVMDKQPPNSFTTAGAYAKIDEATTSTIKVSAFTQDDVGIWGYKFAIDENNDGIIDWNSIPLVEVEENVAGEKTFYNLQANTEYSIYVIAIDYGSNQTAQYEIPGTTTLKVPNVQILGIPTGYVSKGFTINFQVETSLPNITIEYSTDGGTTWTDGTSLTIEKETVNVMARAKDNRTPEPNRSEATTSVITNLDNTAPTITISGKTGDEPSSLKTTHTAVVTLQDDKSQIASNTTIRYAWSSSNTTAPTTYTEIKTENVETQKTTSLEITTPTGVAGEYYLWIDKGVNDSLGNATDKAICSSFVFNIDDEDVKITTIKMYNPTPAVANQIGYVKTNGTIEVAITANKMLAYGPTVTVGGVNVTNITSEDRINWKATVTANTTMPEGELEIRIFGLKSLAGRTSDKEYTNADLTGNAVIYDKTLPELEYIEK